MRVTYVRSRAQVVAGLGQQLTSLWSAWGAAGGADADAWLPLLLDTMLLLTEHPSLTLAHTVTPMWLAFLKHEQISKLPHVLAVVPRWMQACAPKVLKVLIYYQCHSHLENHKINA